MTLTVEKVKEVVAGYYYKKELGEKSFSDSLMKLTFTLNKQVLQFSMTDSDGKAVGFSRGMDCEKFFRDISGKLDGASRDELRQSLEAASKEGGIAAVTKAEEGRFVKLVEKKRKPLVDHLEGRRGLTVVEKIAGSREEAGNLTNAV